MFHRAQPVIVVMNLRRTADEELREVLALSAAVVDGTDADQSAECEGLAGLWIAAIVDAHDSSSYLCGLAATSGSLRATQVPA